MDIIEYSGKEITIMACSDCNTKCKHCYIGYSGTFQGDDLFFLCNCLVEKYRVILNGTELLLHPEFFKSMKLVNQESLITNGIEISNKPSIIDDIVDSGLKYIGVSYHFFIHDEISSVSFQRIQPVLKMLKEAGITTEIRTTVTSQNYDKIDEMCMKAISMGAQGIKFTNYINVGNALNLSDDRMLTREQELYFLQEIERQRKQYRKDQFLIRRCGTFGPADGRKFFCPAGTESVVITPDLKVYPCIFLARKGNEIGFVKNGRVYISKLFQNDNKYCLARNMYNKLNRNK